MVTQVEIGKIAEMGPEEAALWIVDQRAEITRPGAELKNEQASGLAQYERRLKFERESKTLTGLEY